MTTGHFESRTGLSEVSLNGMHERVHLITDVYGACFYGARRDLLLQRMFGALEPGGMALVLLGSRLDRPKDWVELADGTSSDFAEYIAKLNGKNVALVKRGEFSFLVLKKQRNGENLVLPDFIDEQSIGFQYFPGGFTYPDGVRYRAKRAAR